MALFGKKDWGIDELSQFYQLEPPDVKHLASSEFEEWFRRVNPEQPGLFSLNADEQGNLLQQGFTGGAKDGRQPQCVWTQRPGGLAALLGPLAEMHPVFVRTLDSLKDGNLEETDRLALNKMLSIPARQVLLTINGQRIDATFPPGTRHTAVNTETDNVTHPRELIVHEDSDPLEMTVAIRLKEQMVKVLEDPTVLARCPECHSVFVRGRSDQRYCSRRCGDRAAARTSYRSRRNDFSKTGSSRELRKSKHENG